MLYQTEIHPSAHHTKFVFFSYYVHKYFTFTCPCGRLGFVTFITISNNFSVQWNFIYNGSKFDTRMLYAGISFQKKSPLLNITKAGTKIRQIYVATSPRCSTHCVQRLSARIPKSFIRKSQGFILKRMLGCCKTFIIHWCIKVFWNYLPWISCWIIFHPWSIP